METPKWDDPEFRGGTMTKSALWLIQEVGVGNIFTKEQHRASFPGISQADRRMRDLRDYGWAIDTSANDGRLAHNEQRFLQQGLPVWEPGVRAGQRVVVASAKQRRETFAQDSYQCTVCGIGGGEEYLDAPGNTATLTARKVEVAFRSHEHSAAFVTECKRCRSGVVADDIDFDDLLAEFAALTQDEKTKVLLWIASEHRQLSPSERFWGRVRVLPRSSRSRLIPYLAANH